MSILQIPLDRIIANPWQTRNAPSASEYIQELALDIASNGLLQTPIGRIVDVDGQQAVVDWPDSVIEMKFQEANDLRIQLAFGHNRLAAFHWLYDLRDNSDIPGDYSKMTVEIRTLSDEQMSDLAWAENDKRRDCTPVDRALAIRKRMQDFGWSQKDIAEHLRISAPVVSNALRLLDLPEDVLQLISTGEMSERAAMALLVLYDLPASLRQAAENSYYQNAKPSYISDQAMSGLSSDRIRELIDLLVRNHSKSLEKALWTLDYIFVTHEAISWPECRTCELRHKPLNVCTNLSCYDTKIKIWKADYLQQASQVSGILPLEAEIGISGVTDFLYKDSKLVKPILSSGCENLRLTFHPYATSAGNDFTLTEKGFPQATIVCLKQSGQCHCLKGLEIMEAQRRREAVKAVQDTPRVDDSVPVVAEETEQPSPVTPVQQELVQPTAEELQELVRQERKNKKEYERLAEEAKAGAVELVAQGLENNDPGAWRIIYNYVSMGEPWDKRPNDSYNIRLGIAEKLITRQIQYAKPQEVPELLKKLLIDAGIQTPRF